MSALLNTFWQFDSAEFARMHQAEHECRKAWLRKKIEDCNILLQKQDAPYKERLMIIEDKTHFQQLLLSMYDEIVP